MKFFMKKKNMFLPKEKNIFLCLVLTITFLGFLPFLSYADADLYAPGISPPAVSGSDTLKKVSFGIEPSELVFDKIVLVTAAIENGTGRIDDIKYTVYDKSQSAENTISSEISVKPNCVFKYYLIDENGGSCINYPPAAPSYVSAEPSFNSIELVWDKAPDDFDDIESYTIKADGETIAEVSGGTRFFRADNLLFNEEHTFEISASDGSGLTSSDAVICAVMPYSNEFMTWNFDASGDVLGDAEIKYTDEQLKIAAAGANEDCEIVSSDYKYDRTNSKWEEYDIGENTVKLPRKTQDSYLAVIFEDEIKSGRTVNLTFDFWGNRLYQTCNIIYMNDEGVVTEAELSAQQSWKKHSFTVSTAYELSDYGLSGKYGMIFKYKKTGSPAHDAFFFKNIEVSSRDTFCAEAIPETNGENGIVQTGGILEKKDGVISGNPYKYGDYTFGYGEYDINGRKAFYLAKIFDKGSSSVIPYSNSYLGFKVDSDKFAKHPEKLKDTYIIVRYFDGAADGLRAKSFKVYVNSPSAFLGTLAGEVTLSGDDKWHTAALLLPDGCCFGGFDSAGADIGIKLTDGEESENSGLAIRSVSVADGAYYNKYFK